MASTLYQQLQGYRLTTAEIVYRIPDHPAVLQTFVWQVMDIAPRYPRLNRFLDYWEANLDASLHSVRLMGSSAVKPVEFRHFSHEFGPH